MDSLALRIRNGVKGLEMLKSCLPMHQLIDVIIIYLQTLKVENVPFLLDPNILYICVAS